ncbi:amidase family protein [Kordiimonas pumila]|uniref:Amidase family protein n=1 Tax=Kordiimonas pumila TaxID=2161677 RepID=A0ABV7D710_9PROT|nr:amidase family protein [Kordiimonas pumila]
MATMNRRHFLKNSVSTLCATAALGAIPKAVFAGDKTLLDADAVKQAEMVRSGEVSARYLAEEAIARIKRLNPSINAVITPMFEAALDRADHLPTGPFQGVPYLLKDLMDYKGGRTAFGSRMMMGNISADTHVFAAAAEQAGLNIFGKTNTPEFGLLGTTEPLAFGPTANPWNLKYSAGGSSGGAAAAVAAGMVPAAQGSDGGGSVRIPASCCGLFGVKVSRRRNVWPGRLALNGLAVKGHLTRTVRDSAALYAVTEWQGADAALPPVGFVTGPAKKRLKIGLQLANLKGNMPDDDVASAITETAALCRQLGHAVEEVALPFDTKLFSRYFTAMWSRVPAGLVDKAGAAAPEVLEPWTLYLADYFKNTGADDFKPALAFMESVQTEMETLFGQYDVILSPVLTSSPLPLGQHAPTKPGDYLMEDVMNYVGYTPLYNGSGQPAMSVPLNWNEKGLPIGSHFGARLGGERTLFELAYELEQAKPWKHKWAPNSAYYT